MRQGTTARMRHLTERRRTELVKLEKTVVQPGTRSQPFQEMVVDSVTVPASIMQASVTDVDGETANRSVRDLVVWIDDTIDATPAAGWRCTIVKAADTRLQTSVGRVIGVERDRERATRRIDVRITDGE